MFPASSPSERYALVGGILDTIVQGCEDGSSSLRSEHSDPTHILGYIRQLQSTVDALLGCANLEEIVTLGQSGLGLSQRDLDYLCSPLLDRLFTRAAEPLPTDSNSVEVKWQLLVLPFGLDAIYSIFCNAANSVEGLTTLKFLINRGLNVNQAGVGVDDNGMTRPTAFQVACTHNLVDIAEFLLQVGAQLDSVAVQAAYHEDGRLISLLCRHGMDMNTQFSSGRTPLGLAVQMKLIRVAQILIENGADVNGKDGLPLYGACLQGDIHMLRLLLSYPQLNVDLFTDHYLCQLIAAGHLDVLICLQELVPHRTWLGAGVPCESYILQSAVQSKSLTMLEHCLRHGCRASVNNSIALYNAVCSELNLAFVPCLLEHGADPLDLEPHSRIPILKIAVGLGCDFQLLCRMVRHVTVVTDERFVALCALPHFGLFHCIVDIVRSRLLADQALLQRGLTSACKASALQNAGYLVELGADVMWQNNAALLALASSAQRSVLLDHFVRNQSSVIRGLSPDALHDLFAAAITDNVECLFTLHEVGTAAPSNLDKLLISACTFGHHRVVKLLMSLGAKPSEPSSIAAMANSNCSVLHTLQMRNLDREPCSVAVISRACARWVNQPAYIQVLLETGVDVRILDHVCLQTFAEEHRSVPEGLIRVLLRYGLDLSANPWVLSACVYSGCSPDFIRFLLSRGANARACEWPVKPRLSLEAYRALEVVSSDILPAYVEPPVEDDQPYQRW